MLKRETTVAGATVEVLPKISAGIALSGKAGGSNVKEFLSVYNGFEFGRGGWNVTSGTRLEILKGPKRYGEAGTRVEVKILLDGEPKIGNVFWCELRASCKLV